ncbi:MAG TPA: DNA repair protein RadC [Acidobacteriota bacterium]|nr:DNA repair protein RadC [Acidobacteriota bacterium]
MSDSAYSYTIKELPAEERPRERLQRFGPETLSNAELVAILLGHGFHKVSAIDLAQHLLNRHEGLVGLASLDFDALCAEKGIGPAKACQLAAAIELGRRLARSDKPERPEVKTPEQAAALLTPRYGDRSKEHVGLLALDAKNRVVKEIVVSVGTLDGSLVHPREVFRPAVLANACAVILFHNHPSGDTEPSAKDIEVTHRLAEAGKVMGLELVDHIIVARNRFVSLRRLGLMKEAGGSAG